MLPYKYRLSRSIENLPTEYQKDFESALKPYKFNLEVFVPQNLDSIRAVSNKDYMRNKLVHFNENLNMENAHLNIIKSETDKFSKQYKLVTSGNKKIENKYQHNLIEMYKLKGYDDKEIMLNENIFNPSLLLEEESNYDSLCKLETKKDLKEDQNFMNNFQQYLGNRGRSSCFQTSSMATRFNQSSKKIGRKSSMASVTSIEEETDPYIEMSARQIEDQNKLLLHEIRMTESSLNATDYNSIKNSPNKKKMEIKLSKPASKKVVDGLFLSSKGMIRSAKNRKKNSPIHYKTQESTKVPEIVESTSKEKTQEEIQRMPSNTFRKVDYKQMKKEKANKEKERVRTLENLYMNIGKNSYLKESSNAEDYVRKYTKRKIEPVNFNNGSNIRSLCADFRNKIEKTNVPEMSKLLNYKKGSIGVHEGIDPSDLEDLDNHVRGLEYDYAYHLIHKDVK